MTISPEQWPPNSPDLNPVDYKIWGVIQQHVYDTMSVNSSSHWLMSGVVCSTAQATLPSVSGESVCRHVFAQKEDISNICC